jgi:hypothetical protein
VVPNVDRLISDKGQLERSRSRKCLVLCREQRVQPRNRPGSLDPNGYFGVERCCVVGGARNRQAAGGVKLRITDCLSIEPYGALVGFREGGSSTMLGLTGCGSGRGLAP